MASTGILLLTSDGDLARKLLHGGKHEKEYLVGTEPAASVADVAALAGGIDIDVNIGRAGEKRPKRGRNNGWHTARTRRCDVRRLRHPRTGEVRLRFRLRQGLRRQIRLMCEARHLPAAGHVISETCEIRSVHCEVEQRASSSCAFGRAGLTSVCMRMTSGTSHAQ